MTTLPSPRVPDAAAPPSPTTVHRAHLDTIVITAGALEGSTTAYSVLPRRFRCDGDDFFGRVSVCPFVAFFRACRAARTVNVTGFPIAHTIAFARR